MPSGRFLISLAWALVASWSGAAEEPLQVSGIHPHLAMFNDENECGTGAVVPWAGRLWVITYAPHRPGGSTDKLYEITPELRQIVRPESVGGTPANRMIHRESRQLFIGPYVIDAERRVRVIGPDRMFGRLTGNARHLRDPARLVYFATMEEGLYEVDVHSLEVRELYRDANRDAGGHAGALLPGYHGKGLGTAQGRLVYANNGEYSPEAMVHPEVPSGCLAEWDGREWRVVRRNQFTDVSGPGGLEGNHSDRDPLWSIGWDHRSLILMLLEDGRWHSYRLPKGSHSYDGAHGWNTEWPRIREIGERDLLMTMHGMFWRFPPGFSTRDSGGLEPRSSYLKVVGDFARWGDHVVLGCDDTARSEFLNRRRAKGVIAAPQSQSNLWFVEPDQLDELGPVLGRGSVWMEEDVPADAVSEPFLVAGFQHRVLHLTHGGEGTAQITVEVDDEGRGRWREVDTVTLGPRGYAWRSIEGRSTWLRARSRTSLQRATVSLSLRGADARGRRADRRLGGLANPGEAGALGGVVRAREGNRRTLTLASEAGLYELTADLQLKRVEDEVQRLAAFREAAIPTNVFTVDAASVLIIDDRGRRWRFPRAEVEFGPGSAPGPARVAREVATERDLLNLEGTFYELPAENAGGFAKVRPVSTHQRWVQDFCSYRGLLVMSGVSPEAPRNSPHLRWSDDGRAALWVGAVDDLWKLGKPRGRGGPWNHTPVVAGDPSDPYLLTGYDHKRMALSHDAQRSVRFRVEVDVTGEGTWCEYLSADVPPGKPLNHRIPREFGAYWLRVIADQACRATAQLVYD